MKRIFFDKQGRFRTGWMISLLLIGFWGIRIGVRLGLTYGFEKLFTGWGLDEDSFSRAAAWAKTLYRWHGSIVTLAVSLLTLVYARLLRPARPEKAWLPALGIGLGAAILSGVLFLIFDSMRLEWTAPNVSATLLPLILLTFIAAWAEEAFGKSVLYARLRARWGRLWATLFAVILFFLESGGYAGGVLCAVNVALMGWLTCILYEKKGLWASVGFRFGWSIGVSQIMGYNLGRYADSLYALYPVSEHWLTGGQGGPICGACVTVLLIALILPQLRKVK